MLAQSVGMRGSRLVHDHRFLGCNGAGVLDLLYGVSTTQGVLRSPFFSPDPQRVTSFLSGLRPDGNEDLLLALDRKADLPFGSIANTCRIIALFSGEPLEAGAVESGRLEKIPVLIEKVQQRRIKIFAAIPGSPAVLELSQANLSEIEFVEGGDGLTSVDFGVLLGQIGKSISVMSVQATAEAPYKRAIFGQDKWDAAGSVSDGERDRVLAVGGSAKFGDSTPLTNVRTA